MSKYTFNNELAEYIIALIDEFATAYKLNERQAFLYLKNHNAFSFIERHYGVMHTLDFKDSVEGLANYCRLSGGRL